VRAKLVVQRVGDMRSVCFERLPGQEPLAAGHVEVQVESVMLNFKDTMKVMGLLPQSAMDSTHSGTSLGLESCATVVRAAADAKLRVGTRVLCAPRAGALATHTVVHTDFTCVLEAGISPDTSMVVGCTVYEALVTRARLQPGAWILIHAAAGGVGLMAVQMAQHLGARVIATAGSDQRQAAVRDLGVEHVLHSRTLDWAETVLEITGGRGCDVVLNSIAGRAQRLGIDALAVGGHFVEVRRSRCLSPRQPRRDCLCCAGRAPRGRLPVPSRAARALTPLPVRLPSPAAAW
jgi:NADPH:quinone reductase-like Zn-dependent oxidoreductase